jgi:hypothetical protein
MKRTLSAKIGFVFGAALLGALTGCVESPQHGHVYAQAPAYAPGEVVVRDDYIYYPSYQVYYSSNRRQYVYLDGRSWVTRPAPPRVSADVLFTSPSVRLDFHDSPSIHHATVVRQYPKHWAPPGSGHGKKNGHGDDHDNGNKRGEGHD